MKETKLKMQIIDILNKAPKKYFSLVDIFHNVKDESPYNVDECISTLSSLINDGVIKKEGNKYYLE